MPNPPVMLSGGEASVSGRVDQGRASPQRFSRARV